MTTDTETRVFQVMIVGLNPKFTEKLDTPEDIQCHCMPDAERAFEFVSKSDQIDFTLFFNGTAEVRLLDHANLNWCHSPAQTPVDATELTTMVEKNLKYIFSRGR